MDPSNEPRKKYARPIAILMAVALVVVVAFFFLFHFLVLASGVDVRKAEAKLSVAAALKAYFSEYNEPLTGTNTQVMAVLRGQNPRKIVFLEARSQDWNTQGELIDPWGTPYRFDLSDPTHPRVWSCGPNRKDENGAEGSDDIVSWR